MQHKAICPSQERGGGQTVGTVDHGTLVSAGGCFERLGEKSILNADLPCGNIG